MKWDDIVVMPYGELDEYVDQLRDWATLLAGGEVKD